MKFLRVRSSARAREPRLLLIWITAAPLWDCLRRGRKASVTNAGAIVFVSKASRSLSSKFGTCGETPALFMSTSSRPNLFLTSLTTLATDGWLVTSSWM